MTKNQEEIANTLLQKLKDSKGKLHESDFGNEINTDLKNRDAAIKELIKIKLIENIGNGTYQLTKQGWEIGGFARIV